MTMANWAPMTVLVLLFVAPLLFDSSSAHGSAQLQPCGGEVQAACPQGECCGNSGFCGKTDAFCGKGNCSFQCPADCGPHCTRCGPEFDGAECGNGACCSIWGWCGTSEEWCGKETCASQCPALAPAPWTHPPRKLSPKSAPAPPPKTIKSPPTHHPLAEAPEAPMRCGPGFHGETCPDGSCCSVFGWCGGGEDWCGKWNCASQCPIGECDEAGECKEEGYCCNGDSFCLKYKGKCPVPSPISPPSWAPAYHPH